MFFETSMQVAEYEILLKSKESLTFYKALLAPAKEVAGR